MFDSWRFRKEPPWEKAGAMVEISQQSRLVEGLTDISGVLALPQLLAEFGCEITAVLEQAGLAPDVLNEPEKLICAADLSRLFRACVIATQCPHIGLLVGQRSKPSSLDIVPDLIQRATTVGKALDVFMRHHAIHDRMAGVDIEVQGPVAILSFGVYAEVEHADAICDAGLAMFTRVIREMCGKGWSPSEVLLPRYRPVDPAPYQSFFKARLRFDEETAALVFDRRWLAQSLAGSGSVPSQPRESRIAVQDAKQRALLKDELRRVLRLQLLRGKSSADEIAGLFDMRHRTFHRRLRAEGAALRTISNEIRLEIAHQLLADTHIPLSQIAAALAFSEASAFTRAFRRWSGETPSAYRALHHA
jgi:AraC-like DNA-binding protein